MLQSFSFILLGVFRSGFVRLGSVLRTPASLLIFAIAVSLCVGYIYGKEPPFELPDWLVGKSFSKSIENHFEYNAHVAGWIIIIAAVLFIFFPFLVEAQSSVIAWYYRWRLRKSFYIAAHAANVQDPGQPLSFRESFKWWRESFWTPKPKVAPALRDRAAKDTPEFELSPIVEPPIVVPPGIVLPRKRGEGGEGLEAKGVAPPVPSPVAPPPPVAQRKYDERATVPGDPSFNDLLKAHMDVSESKQWYLPRFFSQFTSSLWRRTEDEPLVGIAHASVSAVDPVRGFRLIDSTTKQACDALDVEDPHIIKTYPYRKSDDRFATMPLSQAMSTSAAAVSSHMGSFEGDLRGDMRQVGGLALGIALQRSDPYAKVWMTLCAWLLRIVGVAPFLYVGYYRVFEYSTHSGRQLIYEQMPVNVWFVTVITIAFFGLVVASARECRLIELFFPIATTVHRLIQSFASEPTVTLYSQARRDFDGNPPNTLYLSDGGHTENFALLPLLGEYKYKHIVIADGEENPTNGTKTLLEALDLGRLTLGYRFAMKRPTADSPTGEEDVSTAFIQWCHARRKREETDNFVFWAYYDSIATEIHYVRPRLIGAAPSLNGCCCVGCNTCCSCSPLSLVSQLVCKEFPHHSTGNQFFTTDHFQEYSDMGKALTDTVKLASDDAFLPSPPPGWYLPRS
jgi:hypothetical protein